MNLPITGLLDGKTYLFPVRVYFGDTDAGGVVYHSRYLDFAEHARSELLRLLGENQQEMISSGGSVFVIRKIAADYHRPGKLDDLLTVRTNVTACARATIHFQQDIVREEELLCRMQIKAGFVSLKTGRPGPMPDAWREKIAALL
jgi:acyl-CoA thioester hydrolase